MQGCHKPSLWGLKAFPAKHSQWGVAAHISIASRTRLPETQTGDSNKKTGALEL